MLLEARAEILKNSSLVYKHRNFPLRFTDLYTKHSNDRADKVEDRR